MKLEKLIKKVNKENAPPEGWSAADAVPKWRYRKNKDGFMGSENRILEKDDKPEPGKVYALTGGPGARCIANGYSWKDSVVGDDQ